MCVTDCYPRVYTNPASATHEAQVVRLGLLFYLCKLLICDRFSANHLRCLRDLWFY